MVVMLGSKSLRLTIEATARMNLTRQQASSRSHAATGDASLLKRDIPKVSMQLIRTILADTVT